MYYAKRGAVTKNATIGPLAGMKRAALSFQYVQRSNQLSYKPIGSYDLNRKFMYTHQGDANVTCIGTEHTRISGISLGPHVRLHFSEPLMHKYPSTFSSIE